MTEILSKTLFVTKTGGYTVGMLFAMVVVPIFVVVVAGFVIKKVAVFLYRKARRAFPKGVDTKKEKGQKLKDRRQTEEIYKKEIKRIKRAISLLECGAIVLIIGWALMQTFSLKEVFSVFTAPLYASGGTKISFVSIFMLFVIIYVANFVSLQFKRGVQKFLSYNKKIERNSVMAISHSLRYATLIVIFFIGLPLVGIDISSFVVIFSALGLGVGFGLQDTIANYAAGVTINLTHVIREGDRVLVKDIEGHVQSISPLNTVIRSVTYEELIVPNKIIINEPIQNLSHSDRHILILAYVQVSYASDLDFVQEVVLKDCANLDYLYRGEIYFRVVSFDDSGITICVAARISDVADKFVAKSELNLMLWRTLKKYGIEIPFPQRDIHIKNELLSTSEAKKLSVTPKQKK